MNNQTVGEFIEFLSRFPSSTLISRMDKGDTIVRPEGRLSYEWVETDQRGFKFVSNAAVRLAEFRPVLRLG